MNSLRVRFFVPVKTLDGLDDSIHPFNIHEAHHGPGWSPRLHKTTLDDVGGIPQVV